MFGSVMLMVLCVVDIALGAALLLSSFGKDQWTSAVSAAIVAAYACLLILMAVVSFVGVARPIPRGRVFLTISGYCAVLCLSFEEGIVIAILADGRARFATRVGFDRSAAGAGSVWTVVFLYSWLLAAVAARHALRYAATFSLRKAHDSIAHHTRAPSLLTESLLSEPSAVREREVRRAVREERRDDLRSHFNHKYFGGRDTQGREPQAPAPSSRAAELPSYLLRRGGGSGGDDNI